MRPCSRYRNCRSRRYPSPRSGPSPRHPCSAPRVPQFDVSITPATMRYPWIRHRRRLTTVSKIRLRRLSVVFLFHFIHLFIYLSQCVFSPGYFSVVFLEFMTANAFAAVVVSAQRTRRCVRFAWVDFRNVQFTSASLYILSILFSLASCCAPEAATVRL